MTKEILSSLHLQADESKAKVLRSFFKTKEGEYGYGDIFIGVPLPQIRKIAQAHATKLDLAQVHKILQSKIHEERLLALSIIIDKFEKAKNAKLQKEIVDFYIAESHLKQVNNWDLVDISCYKILGKYLLQNPQDTKILYEFSASKNLWIRRIAIVTTLAFIRENKFADTIKISEILLDDHHNLIHKAVGWMLREIGKKDKATLLNFLNKNAAKMPRVMLSYAVEKFSKSEKDFYRKR